MKIMQVIPTLEIGGAEVMMKTLSEQLAGSGHEVVVVCFYDHDTPIKRVLVQKNIKIITLNKKRGFDPKILVSLQKIIRIEAPSVIHTHLHVLPYVWCCSGQTPIIHTLHSVAEKEQTGVGRILCGWLYQYSRKCTPVALSPMVKTSMVKLWGNKMQNVEIVYNGVDVTAIPRKSTYALKKETRILHVGRLAKVKNHRLMLDTMAQLVKTHPGTIIRFIGEGPERKALEDYTHQLGIEHQVIFVGASSQIGAELSQGDIFILPSEYEGLPLSMVEAMAAGLPVVASNVGGIPDVITDGVDGLLIKPTEQELFSKLELLIGNEVLRESLGTAAVVKAERFSAINMMKGYLNLYESVTC